MLICSCHAISHRDIDRAVRSLLEDAPDYLLTPGLIYQALDKPGKCLGCFPRAFDILADSYRQWSHENLQDPEKVEIRLEAMRLGFEGDFAETVAQRRESIRLEKAAKRQRAPLWRDAGWSASPV